MRATAPSGAAEFEGVVGWSGELGYGVRAAEPEQAVRDAATPKTVKAVSR
jgi:NADH-quinone oxidoreductase subunit I